MFDDETLNTLRERARGHARARVPEKDVEDVVQDVWIRVLPRLGVADAHLVPGARILPPGSMEHAAAGPPT